jgi:PhoH-like ATPase
MADKNQVKSFVIDTNVLIHRPDAIMSFRDNEIIIPLWVLEELDKLKTYSDERGRNARHAIRFLDECSRNGDLSEGVKLDNGSILKVKLTHTENVPAGILQDKMDNKIILAAYEIKQAGGAVFFVSKDINARVKATALGIRAVDYEKQKINISKLYSGFGQIESSVDTMRSLEQDEEIPWHETLPPNFFFVMRHAGDGEDGEELLARFVAQRGVLKLVDYKMPAVAGVRPLNHQQRMALDLLLDPEVQLVSLVGKAGTGKTLLAIAAGLKLTMEDKAYSRVLVSRPVIPMGKDIGFLPGAKDEKLSHWMQPLFDNLEFILSVYKRQNIKNLDHLMNSKVIELEALSYIRGRSLPSQYIIIDEAQNLSPHEIKTIVSRAGEGSKVVLTGDPYQIDSPYLDSSSNGLSYLVEAFKSQNLAGHITLDRSERSTLAELAAELL